MTVGDDGRITGLGEGDCPEPAGEIVDAAGLFVAPGFVSAHSHLYTSGLRGMASDQSLYPWVRANGTVVAGSADEDLYWYTLHGCLDFIGNGITSAYNFTHSRAIWRYDPLADAIESVDLRPVGFLERQVDAAADSGIRILNSIRIDGDVQPEGQALEVFADTLDYVAERTPAGQDLGASVFGSVQWSSTPRTAELEAQLMHEHGIGNQAHFVETAEHIEQQRAKFDWYDDAGALGPGFLFGHFVHPTDHMVTRAAETGCGMVWQPTSNGRLGSGIADIPRFTGLGMPVGVGLDDQSCTDSSDPFQNMRMGMYLLRASRSDASVITAREMLRLHTLGSAEALGVAERIGSLEVGKFADFVIVDPQRPDTGPVWNVLATYVLACGLRNLHEVYIGGRLVSRDGVSTTHDSGEVRSELHERIARAAGVSGMPLAPVMVRDVRSV
ncbi:cytosine deaminase [Subtercola boreus]|uniref:Cytosine deaminase n=2 Tax=Subtercola boreus TaxID=120213 RepID=A0A3E0VNG9_9MICO|nr:cytosine deaminase [Subtercola boreus]